MNPKGSTEFQFRDLFDRTVPSSMWPKRNTAVSQIREAVAKMDVKIGG